MYAGEMSEGAGHARRSGVARPGCDACSAHAAIGGSSRLACVRDERRPCGRGRGKWMYGGIERDRIGAASIWLCRYALVCKRAWTIRALLGWAMVAGRQIAACAAVWIWWNQGRRSLRATMVARAPGSQTCPVGRYRDGRQAIGFFRGLPRRPVPVCVRVPRPRAISMMRMSNSPAVTAVPKSFNSSTSSDRALTMTPCWTRWRGGPWRICGRWTRSRALVATSS